MLEPLRRALTWLGAILGQLTVGVVCDRIGRKAAIVLATGLIVLGGTLATAAHGTSTLGLLWMCVSLFALV